MSRRFDQSHGKKGRGNGKGKTQLSGTSSLTQRIAKSFCRVSMYASGPLDKQEQLPAEGKCTNASVSNTTASLAPMFLVVTGEIPSEIVHRTFALEIRPKMPFVWSG